jgi:hypothetical protein
VLTRVDSEIKRYDYGRSSLSVGLIVGLYLLLALLSIGCLSTSERSEGIDSADDRIDLPAPREDNALPPRAGEPVEPPPGEPSPPPAPSCEGHWNVTMVTVSGTNCVTSSTMVAGYDVVDASDGVGWDVFDSLHGDEVGSVYAVGNVCRFDAWTWRYSFDQTCKTITHVWFDGGAGYATRTTSCDDGSTCETTYVATVEVSL